MGSRSTGNTMGCIGIYMYRFGEVESSKVLRRRRTIPCSRFSDSEASMPRHCSTVRFHLRSSLEQTESDWMRFPSCVSECDLDLGQSRHLDRALCS